MNKLVQVVSVKSDYVLVVEPPGFEVVWEEQPGRLQEIAAACRKANSHKVLVLAEQTSVKLSTTELMMMAKEIAKLGLQVAMVVKNDLSVEHESFFRKIATKHGSPIRFFDREAEAKRWLDVSGTHD